MKNKLNLPTTITATYKIITPMFIGDANQQATAISPQSFKGALRFWWRALAWSDIRQKHNNDEEALHELHHQEALLFGSSADNPHTKDKNKDKNHKIYGKGQVAIKVEQPNNLKGEKRDTTHPILKNYSACRYLGYGVIEAGHLTRGCINEDQSFDVTLIVDDRAYIEEMSNALQLIGLLGGLGSKARKGFGSINLTNLSISGNEKTTWEAPQSSEDYQSLVQKLLSKVVGDTLPPLSALSRQTFITVTSMGSSPYQVQENYGKAMMLYRSWGKRNEATDQHEVLGMWAEQNFPEDHHWSKGEHYDNFHPKRVIFGLPHNYGKIQVGRDLGKQYGRRASPLFFHIQQVGEEFIGIAYVLRSQFLPENEKIKADKNTVSQNINWDILQKNFLSDKQRFPNAIVIYGGAQQ